MSGQCADLRDRLAVAVQIGHRAPCKASKTGYQATTAAGRYLRKARFRAPSARRAPGSPLLHRQIMILAMHASVESTEAVMARRPAGDQGHALRPFGPPWEGRSSDTVPMVHVRGARPAGWGISDGAEATNQHCHPDSSSLPRHGRPGVTPVRGWKGHLLTAAVGLGTSGGQPEAIEADERLGSGAGVVPPPLRGPN